MTYLIGTLESEFKMPPSVIFSDRCFPLGILAPKVANLSANACEPWVPATNGMDLGMLCGRRRWQVLEPPEPSNQDQLQILTDFHLNWAPNHPMDRDISGPWLLVGASTTKHIVGPTLQGITCNPEPFPLQNPGAIGRPLLFSASVGIPRGLTLTVIRVQPTMNQNIVV